MRTRFLIPTVIVLALGAARSAAADTVIVEWVGDFPIPDIARAPGVFIDLEVEPHPKGEDIIRDIDFGFRIPHTWQGDLSIALEHVESGRFVPLTNRPGSPQCSLYGYSADNYGNEVTGERFTLDDEAANPYDLPHVACQGIPDVTGHWRPEDAPLSTFDGDSIEGTWRMWIADDGGGDIGFVRNIVIRFETDACAADLDGDGHVGLDDLLVVLAEWGRCPPDCAGDIDDDGDVDLDDLLAVLAGWGPC